MRKIDRDELKKIQLEILEVVSDYCEKNSINYWIDCGTLLGAVRHKGYIPWDDDIDIGMLREDYDRFTKNFNIGNRRYRCCTMYNTPKFPCAFAKVIDTETELYEPTKKAGISMGGINIDIFVYDNAPNDKRLLAQMYDRRDKNRIWYGRRNCPHKLFGTGVKRYLRFITYTLLQLIPRRIFINKIQRDIKRYSKSDTGYVGNFTSYTRMLCSKDVFDSFVEVEFEGKLYKAPVGYDKWLKSFYGDYWQLPPSEKRKSHHCFEAYVKETNERGDV